MPLTTIVCETSRAFTGEPDRDEPEAAPTAALAGRFRFWRGVSGRRAVFSAYPIAQAPAYAGAVLIAVRLAENGQEAIWIGAVETQEEAARVQAGFGGIADELHVHLLTGSASGRARLVHDLTGMARRH